MCNQDRERRRASSNTVLVLEAGRPEPCWNFRIHMPAARPPPVAGKRYNWLMSALHPLTGMSVMGVVGTAYLAIRSRRRLPTL